MISVSSLVRAARFFESVTRQWLFDNPKTVVLDRHGDGVRYHPALLEIAGALRVQPRLCRPRRPTDKGDVERANRYLHDRFVAARTFTSIEDGNRQRLDFLRTIADVRPQPRFRDRTVAEVFAEEKERRLALPEALPETDLVAPAGVDTTAFTRFGTNLYSVPPRYARTTVALVASDREARLLAGSEVVARHERSGGAVMSPTSTHRVWSTSMAATWASNRSSMRWCFPEHRRVLLACKRAGRIPKMRDHRQPSARARQHGHHDQSRLQGLGHRLPRRRVRRRPRRSLHPAMDARSSVSRPWTPS